MPEKSVKKDQVNSTHKDSNKAKLSKKGLTINFDPEDIEKHLPHLANELKNPTENAVFSLNQYSNNINGKNDEQVDEEISNSKHKHLNEESIIFNYNFV